MSDQLKFQSRRSPVYGRGGMVAASQPLAVAAGLKILAQGGNAADAAIATAAALNVSEPISTGLGGDCFSLYYESATQKVYALNASGRAPGQLTIERLRREGFDAGLPRLHPYTITVPGAAAGWCDLAAHFGRLPLSQTLLPAIHLAEEGFPVSPVTAYFWARGEESHLRQSVNGVELTINGRAPHAGELFANPGLARTLRLLAEQGKQVFYQGEIAEAIVAVIQQAGGCMALEDLQAHTCTWDEPVSTHYRGMRIWECPPNGQGLAALLALNLLAGFDLACLPANSPERLHLQIEAMRLAFADAMHFVADPTFERIPLSELLSEEYAAARRKLIHPWQAQRFVAHGAPFSSSDTVYFSVVDGEGNACSFINSNYMGFGTGIVPHGCGFSLQNRGFDFSLDANHPNALHPGKRPYHTIIPALATRPDGSLFASFGVMGAYMQPQGHMQVVVNLLDDGLDPQAALDRPRFCIEPGRPEAVVNLEEGISPATVASLLAIGHPVRLVQGMGRALFGRGQIIQRDEGSGVLCGGSDPRADGCAMALL